MISIEVKDFGPIVEGTVDLKPLTIFVGPNNSGKSYFAVLAYSLFRALSPFARYYLPPRLRNYHRFQRFLPGLGTPVVAELLKDKEFQKSMLEYLKQTIANTESGELSIHVGELPDKARQIFQSALSSYVQECPTTLREELQRCYATSEIFDLTRKPHQKEGFKVAVSQSAPLMKLRMACDAPNDLQLTAQQFNISEQVISLERPSTRFFSRMRPTDATLIASELIERSFTGAFREFLINPYYLPAARSGILLNHQALASSAVSRATLTGIRKSPEVPLFPGVVADFIMNVLELGQVKRAKLQKAASFFESNVTKGEIDIEVGKLEYPAIYYKSDRGKFELHRTSSMVSELATLILFLKYIVGPNDFLIVEEPESHLHPASQLKMARGIVKLIRAGVNILITTHSDYFVEQLNNFIKLSLTPERERVRLKYSVDDYLKPEEVGAYLFEFDEKKGGSFIKELAVDPKYGFSEEAFARVTEALYKETIRLDRVSNNK